MFAPDQLQVIESLIAVTLNNNEALLHFTREQLVSLQNEVERQKYPLIQNDRPQGEADIVLVCQDCGEAFDDLDASSDHACREDYTEDEAADQWRTSIRAAQF